MKGTPANERNGVHLLVMPYSAGVLSSWHAYLLFWRHYIALYQVAVVEDTLLLPQDCVSPV